MFEKESLAVVRARMPYVDRRALSQAWFSALHLAAGTPLPKVANRRAAFARAPLARALAARSADAVPPGAAMTLRVRPASSSRGGTPGIEPSGRNERGPASPAATLSAERACSYPAVRTSLTLGVARGRVQLVLRREGNVLHVVALCRPEVAHVVRRALACASEHLRARGEVLHSRVNDVETATVPA